MKIIKNKHNHEHVKKEDLSSIASIRKQKKNETFYERVAIVIKKDEYVYSIIVDNDH